MAQLEDELILTGEYAGSPKLGIQGLATATGRNIVARLLKTKGLHVTDAEVLALAKELDGVAVVDDEVARKTAKVYGIAYAGTPYVLVRAVSEEVITRDMARQAVNDMVFAGWRCSVETYVKIMEVLEKA